MLGDIHIYIFKYFCLSNLSLFLSLSLSLAFLSPVLHFSFRLSSFVFLSPSLCFCFCFSLSFFYKSVFFMCVCGGKNGLVFYMLGGGVLAKKHD